MARMRSDRPVVVQQSFPEPRPTTNPYIVMLRDALAAEPGLEVRTFSWRSALFGSYDVFHAHWPEILVTGRDPVRSAVRQLLFAALLLRLLITRTPVVRTVHNIALPSGLTRAQRALLMVFDRRTRVRVALNAETPLPDGPSVVVLHGDYRDWFARYPEPEPVVGRFGYFGLIRGYKNVDGLVRAFRALDRPDLSLEIAGAPSNDGLAAEISASAEGDPRVSLRFAYLTDEELVQVCGRAELVVLPYRHMHNSGGALAALSLDRPVLVPRNAANDRLADEVGETWVQRYDDDLDAASLMQALDATRAIPQGSRPDLSRRSWSSAAEGHLRAYRLALGRVGRAQSRRYSR